MSITQETRREAHERIKPHIPAMQLQALQGVEKLGKATAEMVLHENRAHSHNNVAPRLNELCGLGLVEKSGTLINETGRSAAAYVLTEDGRKYLKEVADREV